jgi:3-deoxy-D-manno-octulosonic-acid transferase
LSRFWEPLLAAFHRFGVQSPAHASRFLQLGASPERVVITGNVKFDVPLPDPSRRKAVAEKLGFLPSETVWACGSTHPGEEALLADILLSLRAKGHPVKMLLAPRHVERAAAVGEMLSAKGLAFRRRSAPGGSSSAPVLLLDTVGELAEAYGAASFAFVGGSLISRGGQNPLEPARWGTPVLFGPHMENFREMAELFVAEKAAVQAPDAAGLEAALLSLLEEPAQAELLSRAALKTADSQRGALEASLALLSDTLAAPSGPCADHGASGSAEGGGCCHG